jgi:hypothetical protein
MADLKVMVTTRNDSMGAKVLEILDRHKFRVGLAIAGYRATGKVTTAVQVGGDFKAEVGKDVKGTETVRISALVDGKPSIIDIPLKLVDEYIGLSGGFSGHKPMVERVQGESG